MKIRAIITGSTGMVGKGVLLECLADPDVESVLVINRSPVGITHDKVKEIILKDFFDLTEIENNLQGYNACFYCLGPISTGMSEKEYARITHDMTLNFAKTLLKLNDEMTFCYVSGAGTDSTETSKMMWARVKGRTENDLLALPFKGAYMFRPAFIQPMKGVKSRTRSYRIFYALTKPLYPILRRFNSFVTNSETVGQAMIMVARTGYHKNVLENSDISEIVLK